MSNNELAITGIMISCVGIIVAIIGIAITSWLYVVVNNIECKRRNEQKNHFKKLIQDNLQEVLDIYRNTITLTSRDSSDDETLEEKTEELHAYFRKKDGKLQNIARDTKFYVSMLSIVDNPSLHVDDVIQKINWLTEEFCRLQYNFQRSKRRWTSLEGELRKNKDFIEHSVSSLNMS